jgi:lysozyme family protein
MNTALDTKQAMQRLLGFSGADVDGRFGAHSKLALAVLEATPDASPWPAVSLPLPASQAGMSAAFLSFVPSFIFEWEGTTFEDDPDDDGNKGDGVTVGNYGTKFGLDAASHHGLDIKALTDQSALAVHWQDWIKAGCDKMEAQFSKVYYNCAMNMGLGEARKFAAETKTAVAFVNAQEAHYRAIAAANSLERKYLNGWLNRTKDLRRVLDLG